MCEIELKLRRLADSLILGRVSARLEATREGRVRYLLVNALQPVSVLGHVDFPLLGTPLGPGDHAARQKGAHSSAR